MRPSGNKLKTNEHQLRQIVKKITGLDDVMDKDTCATIEDVMAFAESGDGGGLSLPCAGEDIMITYDRFSVFQSLVHPRSSPFIAMLMENCGSTIMVMDSVITGSDAVMLAKAFDDSSEINKWVKQMHNLNFTVRPIDHCYSVIVAPLRSFVRAINE